MASCRFICWKKHKMFSKRLCYHWLNWHLFTIPTRELYHTRTTFLQTKLLFLMKALGLDVILIEFLNLYLLQVMRLVCLMWLLCLVFLLGFSWLIWCSVWFHGWSHIYFFITKTLVLACCQWFSLFLKAITCLKSSTLIIHILIDSFRNF